jgi:hypothetical protein
VGGQAGQVRAIGARGRTNRAGPRSSTRGVYTHDARRRRRDAKCTFLLATCRFFHLLLGGYYSTTTCGYYSTTARFSSRERARSRALESGSDTQRTTLTVVGYYSTPHFYGYYSSTTGLHFFSFLDVRERASCEIGFPARRRLPPILPFPRELRCCRTQSRARGAREERGGSGPPRVRHRAVARRRARTALARAWLGSAAHRETRGKEERKLD